MFNSTYGAGYRAGMAQPVFKHLSGALRCIAEPKCPFSAWRFVSRLLWHNGYYEGFVKRLMQPSGTGRGRFIPVYIGLSHNPGTSIHSILKMDELRGIGARDNYTKKGPTDLW